MIPSLVVDGQITSMGRGVMRGTVLDLLGGGEYCRLFYLFVTVLLEKFPGSDALESVPFSRNFKGGRPQ